MGVAEDTGIQIRFHALRHTCVTKLAEGRTSEQTLMAIAGHVSRKMLEHYSHIRMETKRVALDAIAQAPNQAEIPAGVHQTKKGSSEGVPNSLN